MSAKRRHPSQMGYKDEDRDAQITRITMFAILSTKTRRAVPLQ